MTANGQVKKAGLKGVRPIGDHNQKEEELREFKWVLMLNITIIFFSVD